MGSYKKWEFGVIVKALIIYKTSVFPLLLFVNIQGNDLQSVGCHRTPVKPVWVGNWCEPQSMRVFTSPQRGCVGWDGRVTETFPGQGKLHGQKAGRKM